MMEFAMNHPILTTIIIAIVAMSFLGAIATRGKDTIVHHYYYVNDTQLEEEEKKR